MRDQSVIVEQSRPLERLDTFLRSQFPAVSRGTIQRLIEQGHIQVNDLPAKPTQHPRAGDRISIHWPEARPAEALPENIPLKILFEDAYLVVINKPAGLVVHPAAGNEEHTLVNAILHHCAGNLSGIGGVARPGIVHRLDKETSGCLVVAKNDAAHIALSDQFAARTVHKLYDVLLCGLLGSRSGEIRVRIARHPTHRKRMAVPTGGGREAWTTFKVVEHLRHATWVSAELHTGRTHQIRVHFEHLGFPVVGDATYGKRQNKRLIETTGYIPPRQMLHARLLAFHHPTDGRELRFEAPLPHDFMEAVDRFRQPE